MKFSMNAIALTLIENGVPLNDIGDKSVCFLHIGKIDFTKSFFQEFFLKPDFKK